METTVEQSILSPAELLRNWQGHRKLTRRVIELFPEKELFEFSLGNMRSFADMAKELLAIAVPGLKEIVTGTNTAFDDKKNSLNTKAAILESWDEATEQINIYWRQILQERFREDVNLFGQ